MPELPEVETLVQSLKPYLENSKISQAIFLRKDLREKIPIQSFNEIIVGKKIHEVFRRSKYILIRTDLGFALIHLGMSGRLLKESSAQTKAKHTHAIFIVQKNKNKKIFLHYIDPRRFGMIDTHQGQSWDLHPRLNILGKEPLSTKKLGLYLWEKSRNRAVAIKMFLMNANIVVGIGNIYCCEALFMAGISPLKEVRKLNLDEYKKLSSCIKKVLKKAINAGGTTLKDFFSVENEKGYFAVEMKVYGRSGQACVFCQKTLNHITQAGRSTWFCSRCQK